jgi:hypothetical protein
MGSNGGVSFRHYPKLTNIMAGVSQPAKSYDVYAGYDANIICHLQAWKPFYPVIYQKEAACFNIRLSIDCQHLGKS